MGNRINCEMARDAACECEQVTQSLICSAAARIRSKAMVLSTHAIVGVSIASPILPSPFGLSLWRLTAIERDPVPVFRDKAPLWLI
jgi:hypothetical protein